MNRITGNIIPGLLGLFFLMIFSLQVRSEEHILLFPDRSSAVSGDTIWFSVNLFNGNKDEMSNVVHVQLDNLENNHISKVSVLCNDGWGTGYIPVPDSLSTGVYVLRAFSFIQKTYKNISINQRFINVYNRFEEDMYSINIPELKGGEKYSFTDAIDIETGKGKFDRGEEVSVRMNISDDLKDETSQAIITVGLEDPFAVDYSTSWFPVVTNSTVKLPVSVVEKNGVLVSGKVHSAEDNQPVANAVVILSIPDSIPFFDYCVSDSSGIFYFYLRNVNGTADLVLQALAKNSMPCTIELFDNYIDFEKLNTAEKMLDQKVLAFAESTIKASWFTNLFKGYNIETGKYFSMERQFEYPFYGEPTETYYPDLFFDLADFKEISREILHGVQYRERKNGTTIRLLDYGAGDIFKEEPLKLLDGIPVFNPEVFAPMGTQDIDRVDVVFNKRFYGDLSFNGILSIYSKNRSLSWVDINPSTGHFEYSCLQPNKSWNFENARVENTHVPNFNKVLYRNVSDISNVPEEFKFHTSDLKGDAVVRVILIQKNHLVKYSQKIIHIE